VGAPSIVGIPHQGQRAAVKLPPLPAQPAAAAAAAAPKQGVAALPLPTKAAKQPQQPAAAAAPGMHRPQVAPAASAEAAAQQEGLMRQLLAKRMLNAATQQPGRHVQTAAASARQAQHTSPRPQQQQHVQDEAIQVDASAWQMYSPEASQQLLQEPEHGRGHGPHGHPGYGEQQQQRAYDEDEGGQHQVWSEHSWRDGGQQQQPQRPAGADPVEEERLARAAKQRAYKVRRRLWAPPSHDRAQSPRQARRLLGDPWP
jgi:hypothetical protein